mgnify:CR=1 FL=1
MARSTWKKLERRVARFFGSERTPLSGGNSKHTRSDSLHPDLFIEAKHKKEMPVWDWYKEFENFVEGGIPALELKQNQDDLSLVAIHSKYIDGLEQKDWETGEKIRANMGIYSLYNNTEVLAQAEKKIPVLALHKKYKRGFLIITSYTNWRDLIKLYEVNNG